MKSRALQITGFARTRHGAHVSVGGLVIARQRPQTANGIIFLLLEDEGATLNVIIPEKLYDPHRLTIRTQPLILVHGRLERHAAGGGAINLLAASLETDSPSDRPSRESQAAAPTIPRARHHRRGLQRRRTTRAQLWARKAPLNPRWQPVAT